MDRRSSDSMTRPAGGRKSLLQRYQAVLSHCDNYSNLLNELSVVMLNDLRCDMRSSGESKSGGEDDGGKVLGLTKIYRKDMVPTFIRQGVDRWNIRVSKSLTNMSSGLDISLGRERAPASRRNLFKHWDELGTLHPDQEQVRPVFSAKDLYEAISGLRNPNRLELVGGGSELGVRLLPGEECITSLRSLLGDTISKRTSVTIEEWINLGKVILSSSWWEDSEVDREILSQYMRCGCPNTLRSRMWPLLLVSRDLTSHLSHLKQRVVSWELLIDWLLIRDVRLTASAHHHYFPFEETLHQALLLFSRDTQILMTCGYSVKIPQPPTSISQPPTSTSQPPTSTSQPPTSTSQPPTSTSQPPTSTSQQNDSISQPTDSISQPADSISQPTNSVSQPTDSISQPPDFVFQPPRSIAQPPSTTSQPPSTTSQPPSTISRHSSSSSCGDSITTSDPANDSVPEPINTTTSISSPPSISQYFFPTSNSPNHLNLADCDGISTLLHPTSPTTPTPPTNTHPPASPTNHSTATHSNWFSYPPNGVIPHHGFSLLLSPLCYLYSDVSRLYPVFSSLYSLHLHHLHHITSHSTPHSEHLPGGVLTLSCLFEYMLNWRDELLSSHLASVNAQPLRLAIRWMVRAFAGYLDVEQVLTLWDVMIGCGGSNSSSTTSTWLLPLLSASIFTHHRHDLLQTRSHSDVESVLSDISRVEVLHLIAHFFTPPTRTNT